MLIRSSREDAKLTSIYATKSKFSIFLIPNKVVYTKLIPQQPFGYTLMLIHGIMEKLHNLFTE